MDCKIIPFPKKSNQVSLKEDDWTSSTKKNDGLMDDLWDDWVRNHGDEPFDLDYDGDPQPMTAQEQKLFLKDLRKWKIFQDMPWSTTYSDLLDHYDDNQLSLEQEAVFEYLRHVFQRVMEFDLLNALHVLKGQDLKILLQDIQLRSSESTPSDS